jgi:hypothetical protein
MSHAVVDGMLEKSRAGDLRSPVAETLEMHLVEFGRGEADAAMAAATTTILTDEEIQKTAITTIDMFARFIRPVNANDVDRLRAEARVVRAGGRLVWAEAELLADTKTVGKFAATGIRVSFDPQAYVAERGGS